MEMAEGIVDGKMKTKQVILAKYANEGPVTADHIQVAVNHINVTPVVTGSSQDLVLVKNLWISVDPYLRFRMKNNTSSSVFDSFLLNQPIQSTVVSRVIASSHPNFKAGDFVEAFADVSEYAVLSGNTLRKIKTDDVVSLSDYLTLLGTSALTAWAGLLKLGDPKPGEQVFVSAAAGAVGLVVGQLAKIKGCRVVGSAGSDEKVRMLKEEFGFDDAFNYKLETDLDAALTRYFPNGIDIYFENVGGPMLEAVLNHINVNARIPVCGMISQYNKDWYQCYGVRNLMHIIGKSARLLGFTVRDYFSHMDTFREEMIGYMKQGKLKHRAFVKHGIENFLVGFNAMFSGENVGKTLIQLEEPQS